MAKDGMPGSLSNHRYLPTPSRSASVPAGTITLRGSIETVVEFFGYAINSIMYQRGLYPTESFSTVSKYGLSILVTKDKDLQAYIGEVLVQLKSWMVQSQVRKFVMVIVSQVTGATLERWTFALQVTSEAAGKDEVPQTQADVVTCQKEIQAVIRQITASVTFLPLLEDSCTFDLLVFTDTWAEVPPAWDETDAMNIVGGSEEVKLRSFSTKMHRVEGFVSYKFEE
mmetsp:Transcript_52550/g.139981  ORF Transcript_52550/g.139981 Transcript_52550/m.139981 type:complete len:226 (-) Transcript_52550:278-955(-)|eukprot:CAMPEP_0194517216 /NCGR_PEP_ID=MMETSP0253-20130528/50323_1 /TAXON_ID=2966 /ORGANISM="Noctiluca scintillans" /LENGTH=225 /DNA_ID=CAMNT_0039361155 /DNA_START=36 /DNA_END=713 /DNA_ORIENTATION=+